MYNGGILIIFECKKGLYLMNAIINFLITVLIVFFISCEKSILDSSALSDAQIIEMIMESDKIEISIEDMPDNSQAIVNQEYTDYMKISSKKASDLGYEVQLAGLGHRSGHRNEVYFNLKGRKLNPNNWGKKGDWHKSRTSKDDKGDWKCFELVFPVIYEMPDGTTIVVSNDDESGWSVIKTWYDSNPGSEQKPELQFPVVIFYEEESVTIENNQELRGAYVECNYNRADKERDKGNTCFELVYPISYIMPNGTNITIINNDEDGWMELKNWYSNNSDYEDQMPELQYPVNIIYEENESLITVYNEEEMYEVKVSCRNEWEEGYKEECFDLVFPLTFTMPDETTISIENDEDYMNIRNWYLENPDVEEKPLMIYPVSISYYTDEENSIVIVESEEDMFHRKSQCWDSDYEHEEDGIEDCYTFVYPISFLMPDGSNISVDNDEEQGWDELSIWYESNPENQGEPILTYPIDIVIQNQDGINQLTIYNDDELESAEENCQE